MSNDIFEYFEGNSERRVEPVEEDDLLKELRAESRARHRAETEAVDAEQGDEPVESPAEPNHPADHGSADSDDQSRDADAAEAQPVASTDDAPSSKSKSDASGGSWDDLITTLGVEPTEPSTPPEATTRSLPSKEKAQKTRPRRRPRPSGGFAAGLFGDDLPTESDSGEPAAVAEAASPDSDDRLDEPVPHVPVEEEISAEIEFEFEVEDQNEDQNEELTDLAIATDMSEIEPIDHSDFVEEIQDFADVDDSDAMLDLESDDEAEEPFAEDSELLVVDDGGDEVEGEGFVEIEIEDWDDGSTSQPRRRRRRPRRGRSAPAADLPEEDEPHSDSDSRIDNLGDDQEEAPQPRRRKRRRRRRTPETPDDSQSRDRDDRGSYARGPEPRRDRDGRTMLDDDRDDDLGDDLGDEKPKKRRKVPTWEDAISGLIDQNTKRHQSSRSGRGRGRRRRN